MQQYLNLLRHTLENGNDKGDRTGTGTRSVFGHQMRFDLQEGLPLLTTKKLHWRSIAIELLWFLRGDSNIEYLAQNNVHIWDEWPYKAYLQKQGAAVPATNSPEWKTGLEKFISRIATDHEFALQHGELGPIYGVQWRKWPGRYGEHIDQITNAIDLLRRDPESRRHIVSAWNVAEIDEIVAIGGLPPCHVLFQFYVRPASDGGEDYLDCMLVQRSCDLFLGVPFNIASYALLMTLFAAQTGLRPGEFVWTGGDIHLYRNHFQQAKEQLGREPRPLPTLNVRSGVKTIDDYTLDDLELSGYDPHPRIKAPIAV